MSRSPGADVQVTTTGTQCDHNTSVSHVAKPQTWCQGECQGERWGSPTLALRPFSLCEPLGEKNPQIFEFSHQQEKGFAFACCRWTSGKSHSCPFHSKGNLIRGSSKSSEVISALSSAQGLTRSELFPCPIQRPSIAPLPLHIKHTQVHTCTWVHAHANYPLIL